MGRKIELEKQDLFYPSLTVASEVPIFNNLGK